MAEAAVPDGRRQRRREQTMVEILNAAVQAMADDGVAGMSLSDVARRVGMRPPSLYEYFPNKMAIYDAVFRIGFEELNSALRTAVADWVVDPLSAIRTGHPVYMQWCIEHPIHAQLMFWRPVPGYVPSPDAFAPSIENLLLVKKIIATAVELGQLEEGAASEEGFGLYTFIGSGLITQQLANDPQGGFPDGQYSRHTSAAVEMWISRYSPDRSL